jgi:hypothetical protein
MLLLSQSGWCCVTSSNPPLDWGLILSFLFKSLKFAVFKQLKCFIY